MSEIRNDRLIRFAERTSAENEEATLAEMAQRVTDARAEDGDPLRALCRTWDLPYGQFMDWLEEDEDRWHRYERALKARADGLMHQSLQIAATPQAGVITKEGPDGTVTTTEDMLGHRKLQVETNLKVAARWDARRFGDSSRVDLTVKPLRLPNWEQMDEPQRIEVARRIAFVMARGAQAAEQKKHREPRLLEGTASQVAEAAPAPEPYDPGV